MSLSINSSTAGTSPSVSSQQNTLMQQISSGRRINSAADDAAGLVVDTGLSSQIRGDQVAIRNAADGISYTQVASGALSQVTDNLQRIRELSVQAGNGILSDSDRSALQKEVSALSEANQQILSDSSFNGVKLFSNDNSQVFQVGANSGDQIEISGSNLLQQIQDSGANELNIGSAASAGDALATVDNALSLISQQQSELGAVANRFEASVANTQVSIENSAAAQSRISDTDLASATAELVKQQILGQAQIAVQGQANAQTQQMLRLLGG